MGPRLLLLLLLLPLLLLRPPQLRAQRDGSGVNLTVVCYNYNMVDVSWDGGRANLSLLYRFDQAPGLWVPCDHYRLRAGRTSGCRLSVRGRLLRLRLLDGRREVLTWSRLVSQYLKPAPLHNLTFLWRLDGVDVVCPALPYRGLRYQVQYRGLEDGDWETREQRTCAVALHGLDPGRCHRFRARAVPSATAYGDHAQPGEWTAEAWGPPEACKARPASPALPPVLLLLLLLLSTLLACALLGLCLWRLHRMRRLILPWIPDPRGSFLGLFETHHGHFQEWIAEAHEVHTTSPENSYPSDKAPAL